MTDDLISRKEAVEAVKNEMLSWLEGDSHDYRNVVDAIMDLLTVDAIPIEWINEWCLSQNLTYIRLAVEKLLEDWREDNDRHI